MSLNLLQEVEDIFVQTLAPIASLQRERMRFDATRKAFNMSASYATSFGSGAREQIQNWWDQCRVMVPDRQPATHDLDSAVSVAVDQRHELREDAKAYAACGQGRFLGFLLDCTDRTGQQLLFLKNYGAQMTLDNFISGESTMRHDKLLAGLQAASHMWQVLHQFVCCTQVDACLLLPALNSRTKL